MALPIAKPPPGEPLDTLCPSCGGLVPDTFERCPRCKGDLANVPSEPDLAAEALARVQAMVAEADAPAQPLPGRRIGAGEIASAAVTGLAFVGYFLIPRDWLAEEWTAALCGLAAVVGVVGILHFMGGNTKPAGERARTAEEALSVYFHAILRDDWQLAHESLSGFARSRTVRVPRLPPLRVDGGQKCSFSTPAGVKRYWLDVLGAGIGQARLLDGIHFEPVATPLPDVEVFRIALNIRFAHSNRDDAATVDRLRCRYPAVVVRQRSRYTLLTGELFSPVDAALARQWLPPPAAQAAAERATLPPATRSICMNAACLTIAGPADQTCSRCGQPTATDTTGRGGELLELRAAGEREGLIGAGEPSAARECPGCAKTIRPELRLFGQDNLDPVGIGMLIVLRVGYVRYKTKYVLALACPSCHATVQVAGHKPAARRKQRIKSSIFWGAMLLALGGAFAGGLYYISQERPEPPEKERSWERAEVRRILIKEWNEREPEFELSTAGSFQSLLTAEGGVCDGSWYASFEQKGLIAAAREAGFIQVKCVGTKTTDIVDLNVDIP